MELLSEDMMNTTEQLDQLTKDSKKQVAILQLTQDEAEKKAETIRELQTKVSHCTAGAFLLGI